MWVLWFDPVFGMVMGFPNDSAGHFNIECSLMSLGTICVLILLGTCIVGVDSTGHQNHECL